MLGFPIQYVLVKIMFMKRKKCLVFTDKRIRIITEVLQGIRLIKSYAWEGFYVQQVGLLRSKEVQAIRMSAYVFIFIVVRVGKSSSRGSSMARSSLIAFMSFIPILASVLSFVRHSTDTLHLNGY